MKDFPKLVAMNNNHPNHHREDPEDFNQSDDNDDYDTKQSFFVHNRFACWCSDHQLHYHDLKCSLTSTPRCKKKLDKKWQHFFKA